MDYRFPTTNQIKQKLSQGLSYAQAIDNVHTTEQHFNKYANFKITTYMSEETSEKEERNQEQNERPKRGQKRKKLSPEEINKETFRWRTGSGEHKLEEMDLDLKLVAYTHALKKANDNFSKRNNYRKQAEICHKNVKYFMKLLDVLEEDLLERHNLQVPSDVDDVRAMRRMIDEGIMTVDNFKANDNE